MSENIAKSFFLGWGGYFFTHTVHIHLGGRCRLNSMWTWHLTELAVVKLKLSI